MADRLIEIDWMWDEQLLLKEVMVEGSLLFWLPSEGDKVNLSAAHPDFTVLSVTRELDDPAPTVTIQVEL